MLCSLEYLNKKAKEKIEGYNYTIKNKKIDNEYNFYICQKSPLLHCDEENICDEGACSVCRIYIVLGDSRIVGDRGSRSQSRRDGDYKDAFTVTWVKTESGHKGEQLALFLLIYSISYCYMLHPDVKYFVLDDDSNLSVKVSTEKKNIYDRVGFCYKDLISIKDTKRGYTLLNLSGPDKQVGCSRFIERSLEIIAHEQIEQGKKRARETRSPSGSREKKKTKRSTCFYSQFQK
jgi:hypothetical protein